MSQLPAFEYSRLRSWYLATLRKRIVDLLQSGALTPAQRILADREAVYKLVADASEQPQKIAAQQPGFLSSKNRALMSAIPLLLHLPVIVALVFFCRQSIAAEIWCVLCLVIVVEALGISVVMAKLNERRLTSVQSCIANKIAKYSLSTGGRAADWESLVETLCDLLLQTTEREHAIADYALDFFCALDLSGRFVAASPSSSEFFGLAPAEILDKNFSDFVFVDDRQQVEKTIRAISKSSGPIPFESRVKHLNGSLVDVVWHAEWSRQESACFCIGKNVSAQRQLERTKQEFISMVGHDLKTPITSIDCTLELLSEGTVGGQDTLVSNARGSVANLLKLIDQLLELERMEDGKYPVKKQPENLESVFNAAVGSISTYAQREKISVIVMPCDFMVNVDAEKIQQVLINLLGNAIKFSPSAGSITVAANKKDETEVLVSVTDQGRGIAPENQEKIFDRFQQITSSDRKHGSGLGLSICRAIVQSHSGTIGVESAEGKGSRFWFTLPLSS